MTGLPAALAPWSEQLSVLYADVAVALGPWVRRITGLIAADDLAGADSGEPDGYDGLSTRGHPDRMLASEWLLATELPEEFLRRAVTGELTYLAQAARQPAPSGSVVAVVDCGPRLWGAPRLAQLATLLVLHRRATEQGAAFELRVLRPDGAATFGGPLDQVVRALVKAREHQLPDPARVRALLADLPEQTWLLTAPGATAEVGHRRTVTYEEGTWTDSGVADVRVGYAGRRFALALPTPELAVRVLRGKGFATPRQVGPAAATTKTDRAPLRLPVFPDTGSTLLARGGDDRTIVAAPVLDGRMRQHRFTGPVVTAWRQGRRVLALVHSRDGRLCLEIAGKPLPELTAARWSTDGLPCDPDGPLTPVYVHEHAVFAEFVAGRAGFPHHPGGDRSWRRLTAAGAVEPTDIVAARSRPGVAPLFARRVGERLRIDGRPELTSPAILAPDEAGAFAWTYDGGVRWQTFGGHEFGSVGGDVLGVTLIRGELSAVALSSGGHIVRQVTERATRTLTRWSFGGPRPSLHPSRPWLAVTRPDGTVAVADLDTDRVLREWRLS
ncbi:hypothetical protein [Catellatospora tritici]|uniref:hypothetical protein n=1 Tax=Catellatospora tritici TaxID=2851566 RepID=UPI001C2D6D37|nr:hypothetical protein [Catellatospora tritici]MBV1856011.1 hypothetical protein [Catellatospora tritici]